MFSVVPCDSYNPGLTVYVVSKSEGIKEKHLHNQKSRYIKHLR